jgi:hypothetical protein
MLNRIADSDSWYITQPGVDEIMDYIEELEARVRSLEQIITTFPTLPKPWAPTGPYSNITTGGNNVQ